MSAAPATQPYATHLSQFADPASDFGDGLRVLLAYHDAFLLAGQRLLRIAEGGQDPAEARELAAYYDEAMRRHHRDEERILFPAIVNRSFLIDGMIERLALDHDEIEALWAELAPLLRRPEDQPGHWPKLARRFERLLRVHIERENEDFLPEIERLITQSDLEEIGRVMQRSRKHAAIGYSTALPLQPSRPMA
jgi:hemerythrin-like domain-containing protein